MRARGGEEYIHYQLIKLRYPITSLRLLTSGLADLSALPHSSQSRVLHFQFVVSVEDTASLCEKWPVSKSKTRVRHSALL